MRLIVSNKLKNFASRIGLLHFARDRYMKKYFNGLYRDYKKYISNNVMPLPDSIIWEPTGKCNLRCNFCFINFDSTAKVKEMDFNDFKIMMEKMPFIKHINMVGGELTLRSDLIDIIKYCKEKHVQINMITNATLMSENLIKNIAEHKDMTSVTVSIDGPEKIHNIVRGWDKAYQRAMESIKLMRKKGILVNVSSIITKENLSHIKELVKEIKNSGANYMELKFEKRYTKEIIEETAKMLNLENTINNFPLSVGDDVMPPYSIEELKVALNEYEDTADKLNLPFGYYPFFLKKRLNKYFYRLYKNEEHFCKHLLAPRIDCSGEFIFCFAIKKSFGNILKQSFEEIWYGKELEEFRKKFVNNPILPICITCEKLIVVEKPNKKEQIILPN